MYYKLDDALRKKLAQSIQRNRVSNRFFSVPVRESVPRDVLLAHGRIATAENARAEMRKYGYGSTNNTSIGRRLIQPFLRFLHR